MRHELDVLYPVLALYWDVASIRDEIDRFCDSKFCFGRGE